MKILLRFLFLIALIGSMGASWPLDLFASSTNNELFGTSPWIERQVTIIKSRHAANNLDPTVLRLSLKAYINARKYGLDKKQLLTIIDYSKPSTEKRLWVIDLHNGKTLFYTWVSHGRNSGGIYSTSFSNVQGSLKSSLGVFVTTSEPYVGSVGYALRLKGLEPGVNDNAYDRAVVVHGAAYVNSDTIRKYGQIGRSWGCPAVGSDLARPIINTIKENTIVFAYYPDRKWLSHSQFLAA